MGKIDVNKLKGKYYNNDKDSYYDSTMSLGDVKTNISVTDTEPSYSDNGELYDDLEAVLVDYIRKQPFAEYNNILDDNSQTMTKSEMTDYLLQTYVVFKSEMSLCFVLLTFCDYFNIEYIKLIKELPNSIQTQLYEELLNHTSRKDRLNEVFNFEIDVNTPKLF